MTLKEAIQHGKHHVGNKYKNVLVAPDGTIYQSNDEIKHEGHLVKKNGAIVVYKASEKEKDNSSVKK